MEKDLLLNNKMIAEFMNLTRNDYGMGLRYLHNKLYSTELFYHQSWDWLMPVIEKISSISTKDNEEEIYFYPRTFGMINNDTGNYMFRFNRYPLFEHSLLITAAYFAVLNFIEHYNTLNQ